MVTLSRPTSIREGLSCLSPCTSPRCITRAKGPDTGTDKPRREEAKYDYRDPRGIWEQLNPRTQRTITMIATVEGMSKAVALIDLARRPASHFRGSKAAWATAITLINSAGLVSIAYFLRGRTTA